MVCIDPKPLKMPMENLLMNTAMVVLVGLLFAVCHPGRGLRLLLAGGLLLFTWVLVTAWQWDAIADGLRSQMLRAGCALLLGGVVDFLLQRLLRRWSAPNERGTHGP